MLKILILGTKFAQEGYFRSKTKKVNITIEALVWVPNLANLHKQLSILRRNLPKRGIIGWKQNKWK